MTGVHSSMKRRNFLISGTAAGLTALCPSIVQAGNKENSLDFFVLGDWGRQGDEKQKSVAEAMVSVARTSRPDFVISVGDNFYSAGVNSVADSEWSESFEKVYADAALQCPWYAILGNHDRSGNTQAQTDYKQVDDRWNMPAAYYVHSEAIGEKDTADFFFLDTTPIARIATNGPDARKQLKWLDAQLAKSRASWKIVVGHHPVFSSGKHGNTLPLVEHLQPILERHRVHIYFSGHDHDLEYLQKNGVNYLVAGSGARTTAINRITAWWNGSSFQASELGFTAVHMTPGDIRLRFLSADAVTLYETSISHAA